jgi:UDP-N-acetyl-D-glucosamine/UDP-N-acetyl-D-galactosamine dehydrogenase
MSSMPPLSKICVIGLGYVGLPLAVALAKRFDVTGFDINTTRIDELKNGTDRTREIETHDLKKSTIKLTTSSVDLKGHDIFIVTVPTPVDDKNLPDLTPVIKASETVGKALEQGNIVVYESTVYPGVTEDICGPILEKISGLKCGSDFYLGYSPERINPGDKEHTVDRITKVVAGQTQEVALRLAEIYGSMNKGNIFVAANIKTAEAAKVIENAQRDINIAFINEITLIFQKVGISVFDVLEAAGTKWNFLKFAPGLVGGHCIGVDPFYLSHCARMLGHNPEIILSGRRINDSMGKYVGDSIADRVRPTVDYGKTPKVLVLGLTFKENIPDLRNTKVIDVIETLKSHGHEVHVHDGHADPLEAKKYYNLDILSALPSAGNFDAVIAAVPHEEYLSLDEAMLSKLVKKGGLVADLKGVWRKLDLEQEGFKRWTF